MSVLAEMLARYYLLEHVILSYVKMFEISCKCPMGYYLNL